MNYDCSISYGLRLTTPIVDRGLWLWHTERGKMIKRGD